MNPLKLQISESLSGLLAQMNPKQQSLVAEMIDFYIKQYKSLREGKAKETTLLHCMQIIWSLKRIPKPQKT